MESPKPGIPASTICACESLALIASWEIFSRLTYFWADWATLCPGVKNFFRLGSFQICQDWTGSAVAPAPYFSW